MTLANNAKYTATMRYSTGYTDPRGFFGDRVSTLFMLKPAKAELDAVFSIDEPTLVGLWHLKFPAYATGEALIDDPFYYALAYRWWNEDKLERFIEQDSANQKRYMGFKLKTHTNANSRK